MNKHPKFYTSITHLALATVFLLIIPLIAMQFTAEVVWTLSDFVIAGFLLFGTGFMYLLITRIMAPRMADNIPYRVAVGFALFTGLFMVWVNLAVGIIGSEENPFNVIYFAVIAVGIIGGFISRFRSRGMVLVLFAMAIALALITVAALFIGIHNSPGITLYHVLGVNGFFITLFVVSALLFQYAEQERTSPNEGTKD